ncbi:MAG: arginine--tRNA ligase [candidate division Zixibacteria bacterium]|nr:arginine--tRNA ligase [candidate division Zixibacteria bacterium]
MASLTEKLTILLSEAFSVSGYDPGYGVVEVSNRPDLCQFQCNGALSAAKRYGTSPRQIAERVVAATGSKDIFLEMALAGPGFINLTLSDRYLSQHLDAVSGDSRLGCDPAATLLRIIVDYGGPNVAKPLHVGHLRAAIIGESLKRVCGFLGHVVWGDVHLGDWGLQMGLNIVELKRRRPDLPYFDERFSGPYPDTSPVTIADLEEMYPAVSERSKTDPETMDAARQATADLQNGRPGYRALWRHFHDVSVTDLNAHYATLNIHFDLWLGESDTQDRIPVLIERLKKEGHAYESEGALVVDVATPEDTRPIPPLMLVKSDGAVLYGTTDLATIDQRVRDYSPDLVLYVVDNRQSDHFHQVFTAAYKTGVAPHHTVLEHDGFGTMNGRDGKPFKTREGGVMKLKDLIRMVTDAAMERIAEIESVRGYSEAEKAEIALRVGVSALKYADLMNHRTKNYIFDLERFLSFEGRTGPYLLYTTVRIKSILRRAAERNMTPGPFLPPSGDLERELSLCLSEFPDTVRLSFETRAPNHLCDLAFRLATIYNRFYHEHHILNEENVNQRDSWLSLSRLTLNVLEKTLDLLGIETPERM